MTCRVKNIEIHPASGLSEAQMALAVLNLLRKWKLIRGMNTLNLLEAPALIVVDFTDKIRVDVYHSEQNGPKNEALYWGQFTSGKSSKGEVTYKVVEDGCHIILTT